jgi:hypothetical protein
MPMMTTPLCCSGGGGGGGGAVAESGVPTVSRKDSASSATDNDAAFAGATRKPRTAGHQLISQVVVKRCDTHWQY